MSQDPIKNEVILSPSKASILSRDLCICIADYVVHPLVNSKSPLRIQVKYCLPETRFLKAAILFLHCIQSMSHKN